MKNKTHLNKNHTTDQHTIVGILDSVYAKTSSDWKKIKERKLLKTFTTTVKEVEAYREYLKRLAIDPKLIKTFNHFDAVPPITKKDYLRAYSWDKLCKLRSLKKGSLVMTATSGSTGAPFYFPRVKDVDMQSSVYHQMFLDSSRIHKNKSTLVIDCFGMGVWIGGLLTL